MRMMFLLGILFATSGLAGAAVASDWLPFGFDGNGFTKGAAGSAIQVRDGYLPVASGAPVSREDKLPEGTGAVALLCYQQRSGGKLRSHAGFAPLAGVLVTVTGNGLTLGARTDAGGYLILALPPGSFELRVFGFSKKVTVEAGKSALVALRGGKRMVD